MEKPLDKQLDKWTNLDKPIGKWTKPSLDK